ncbi:MAG: threonine synthase [Candidatus Limnocylindria bacterium]
MIDPASLAAAPRSYVTHLECARCAARADAAHVAQLCAACGGPYLVRYDLDRLRTSVPKSVLYGRQPSLWRYRELLPLDDAENKVSLGETNTPLTEVPVLAQKLGLHRLTVKDEGLLPTGTFKARGAAVGVTRAGELGVTAIALPTAGNAGAAWAAYGARAGIGVVVVMPEDTPDVIRRETAAYGARVYLVDGSIADAAAAVKRACAEHGWYDASTLKEPYRVEGKKTMGFELAEQLGWHLPDVIVYPTGGGVGLIGMWKAFEELRALGWLAPAEKRPRFIAVQAAGCAPIVKAFHAGAEESEPWPDPRTFAAGLRVPKALGDFLVLRILRESSGVAIDVSDERIAEMMKVVGVTEGLLVCPEGAAAFEAAFQLRQQEFIAEHEDVVVFNTGTGLKYAESLQGAPPIRLQRGEAIPRVERQLEEAFEYQRPLAFEQGRLRVAPDEETEE